jgi:parallel beta-helix repeat protein
MKSFILQFSAFIAVLFASYTPGFSKSFIHPGIDMNRVDLEYMRKQVHAGAQPWKEAYDLLKAETPVDFQPEPFAHVIRGPYAKPDIGASELSKSSRMAYSSAILWYISRDDRYAETVIRIIEKWSEVLRSFDENDSKLLVGLTGYEFCNAAEILRYNYSGWKDEDTDNMTKMMMTVFYPTVRYYFPTANGNWDGAIMHTLLAIAVFTDNQELFDNAVYHYLHGSGNGSIIKYIYPSGQCEETRRDQGHVQMGLYEFSGAARIAYTQGIDLFSVADNRLALGLEYSAKFICGDSVFVYGQPSQRERYKYRQGYEYCIDHYTAKGISMPHLKELCRRTKLNNQYSALMKLTAYRDEFKNKPDTMQEVKESKIAFHTGASLEKITRKDKTIISVKPEDDLQRIIDANAGNGKTIFLTSGEYILHKSLRIPSGLQLCGEGRSSVILCGEGVRTAAILLGDLDARNITIENLVIDGASQHNEPKDPNAGRFNRTGIYSNSLAGIAFWGEAGHNLSNIKFANLTIVNFSRSGIYISDAKNITIENCDFSQNGSHVIPGPRLTHNLFLQNCSEIDIKGSRFDTSINGCGIVIDHGESAKVTNCEIARNGWHGIMLADCRNCVIDHCLIEGNDANGVMCEYLHSGSINIRVKHNKIQCNNGFGVQTFATEGLDLSGNIYNCNGKEKAQESISRERKLQLERL